MQKLNLEAHQEPCENRNLTLCGQEARWINELAVKNIYSCSLEYRNACLIVVNVWTGSDSLLLSHTRSDMASIKKTANFVFYYKICCTLQNNGCSYKFWVKGKVSLFCFNILSKIKGAISNVSHCFSLELKCFFFSWRTREFINANAASELVQCLIGLEISRSFGCVGEVREVKVPLLQNTAVLSERMVCFLTTSPFTDTKKCKEFHPLRLFFI